MGEEPINTAAENFPSRLYMLDAGRGIAALAVVFWHWQHFVHAPSRTVALSAPLLPFYNIFFLFYQKGLMAVTFFFVLSGFTFHWLYQDRIASGRLTFKDFWVLRFSRLYPLHAATLFLVLVLQKLHYLWTGKYFIYPYNDAYHFLLNLGFASYWGLEKGISFNGPAWSVSLEVLLYLIFFITCSLKLTRLAHMALLICCLILICNYASIPIPLAGAALAFYAGGISYRISRALVSRGRRGVAYSVAGACILSWALVLINVRTGLWAQILAGTACAVRPPVLQVGLALFNEFISSMYFLVGMLYPLTLISLALWESRMGRWAKKMAFLGEISYSSYLLHFPLQLVLVLLFVIAGQSRVWFFSKTAMIVYFGLLIPASYYTYRFFERPAQDYLRKKLL